MRRVARLDSTSLDQCDAFVVASVATGCACAFFGGPAVMSLTGEGSEAAALEVGGSAVGKSEGWLSED